MASGEPTWAFAWAEDSRTEAFEALRLVARILGVRKSGLGGKVSLRAKEVMVGELAIDV